MRGIDHQQSQMFSYLSPETRVRKDHPLRAIRVMVDEVLAQLSRRFDAMYASAGRPSIPPEKLLRAQLLQLLYSIRSERLLMEEIDYSVLFRWFVGLNLDEEVWDATTFTKNRIARRAGRRRPASFGRACPRAFTRRTQKPLSSLWKVTRSITPEISSVAGLRSGIAAVIGDSFSHGSRDGIVRM